MLIYVKPFNTNSVYPYLKTEPWCLVPFWSIMGNKHWWTLQNNKYVVSLMSVCWMASSQRTCGAPTSAKATWWRKAPSVPLSMHIQHQLTILMCLLTSPPLSHCWWASSSPLSQVWTPKPAVLKSNLTMCMNVNIVLPKFYYENALLVVRTTNNAFRGVVVVWYWFLLMVQLLYQAQLHHVSLLWRPILGVLFIQLNTV